MFAISNFNNINKFSAPIKFNTSNPVAAKNLSFEGSLQGSDADVFEKKPIRDAEFAKKLQENSVNCFSKGDYTTCATYAKKALELNPESGQTWHILGSAERMRGNYADAIDAYTKAIEFMPESANTFRLRGAARENYASTLKDDSPEKKVILSEAKSDYISSLAIKKDVRATDSLALLQMKTRDYSSAAKTFDTSIELYTKELEKQQSLANTDAAQQTKTKLAKAHRLKGNCLTHYARSIRTHSYYERAVEEYDKAIQYEPDNANNFYKRAVAQYQTNSEGALSDVRKAIDLDDKQAKYWEFLSKLLIQSDDKELQTEGFNALFQAQILK